MTSTHTLDNALLEAIESAAIEIAWGAGEILSQSFGKGLEIEYKDKAQRDPVTSADKATQEYLEAEIRRRFPEHGILGEENADESDTPAPDTLWVLDPLDGTTNFLNGLPVYASSIGVMHRGRLVAGALYLPWPTYQGGMVMRCRRGGGCFADDRPVSVFQSDQVVNNRLVGLPGSFAQTSRFGSGMQGRTGEPRTTGSIAYELAMTACGVLQYAIIGAPRLWDMAAGAIAVQEAGGTVMTRFRNEKQWHLLDSLIPTWEQRPPTMKELRRWVAPLVSGNTVVAPLVAHNLHRRFRPLVRLRQFSRRLRPSKKK